MTAFTLMLVLTTGNVATAQLSPPEVRVQRQTVKPDMVLKWNEIALQAIRVDRSPPPIAARNLAVLHVAIYDAVMAIERIHQPYMFEANPLAGASSEAAAAAAAHRVLTSLYPRQRDHFDLMLQQCWTNLPRDDARDQSTLLGRLVAERVLEARRNDGSERVGTYLHKNAPGLWQPTLPRFQEALLPEWGYVKPFAIRKGSQYRPPPPAPLTSTAYADAFNEVKRLGGKNSVARSPEQTQIAQFWADDLGTVTPPGHWNRIAQGIAQDRGNSLADNARLFAHLNITLADAAVLCWVIKFTFEFWRPVTAIRNADVDGNPDTDNDETWTPLLNTPPFPAYTSGHSTFSGAAATLLAHSFGTDSIRFSTTSDDLPGVTRSFNSLWAAAQEAGMSRIYGGIHWNFDNTEGLNVGRKLGENVYRDTLAPRPRQVLRPAPQFQLPPIIEN